jgi:hypothetical protein
MDAVLKLDEASYFLGKLKSLESKIAESSAIEKTTEEFAHNLSAFVSAWRSVWEVLRHDFAEKYLKVSRDEELRGEEFEKRLNQNPDTIPIAEWLKNKFGILEKSPLWEIRNYNIHGGIIEIDREQRPYPITETYGSITATNASRKSEPKPSVGSIDIQNLRICFRLGQRHDIEHNQIIPMCAEALELMQNIVKDASEKFKI